MSAHTPGPWEFTTRPDSAGVSRPVVTAGFDLICAVSRRDGNDAESHANAQLMAAAPLMLEALEVVAATDDHADGEVRSIVRAAIAKAAGVLSIPKARGGK